MLLLFSEGEPKVRKQLLAHFQANLSIRLARVEPVCSFTLANEEQKRLGSRCFQYYCDTSGLSVADNSTAGHKVAALFRCVYHPDMTIMVDWV